MSLANLETTLADLPWSLREQILGYAESVDRAAPEIFREAGFRFDRKLADKLVFVAGLKKLYSVVSGAYWTLDNSANLLGQAGVQEIRIGGTELTRGDVAHRSLKDLLLKLDYILERENLKPLVLLTPADILKGLKRDG